MDFIIDEAEVSEEIYSENSDCSDNENLLNDDFIDDDQKFENDSLTFYRNFDNLAKISKPTKKCRFGSW